MEDNLFSSAGFRIIAGQRDMAPKTAEDILNALMDISSKIKETSERFREESNSGKDIQN